MNWIKHLFTHRKLYDDLSLEIHEHLEEKITELVESGISRVEAESVARCEFGNITLIEERGREIWQWQTLETFLQDVRHSFRLMRKNPTFTAIAALTLALGIGANTALFSLLDSLVMRDLPVPHPEQLVCVGAQTPGDSFAGLSLPMFEQIARDQKVFSSMFAWSSDVVLNVDTNGALSRADIWAAGGNFYSELGAVPEIGRLITPEDVNLKFAVPAQVAVLGYGFWQSHYGGNRDVIGKKILIEDVPFTIIGVTHKGFTGIVIGVTPEVTVPITAWPLLFGNSNIQQFLYRSDSMWLEAAGRLKAGTTVGRARAQLESIWPSIRKSLAPTGKTALELSQFFSLELKVEPGEKGGSFLLLRFVKALYVLLAIAGIVLLIACVNLASLMLARARARSHEMGIRLALGASRTRLARQVLTESLTLSLIGAVGAFAFSLWGSRTLSNFILGEIFIVPAELNLSPDWRILAFTTGAAVLTAVLFGSAPAWRTTREDPTQAVQQGGRTLTRTSGTMCKALVVLQVALSLVLLVCAGLFVRSLERLRAVDPGFRTRGVLEVELTPKPGGYKNLAWVSYYRDLNERISRIPGVVSAAFTHSKPAELFEWTEEMRVRGGNSPAMRADLGMVMPNTFHALNMHLLRGRNFTWHDDDRAPRVAIVSENLADQCCPRGEAIGQHLDITTEPQWQQLEIIGIVSNASLYDVRKHQPPTVYLPTTQYGDYMGYPTVLLVTNSSPAAIIRPLRQILESLGHEYVSQIKTVEQGIDRSLLQERVTALLSAFFGALALILAAVGLYGLMAYNVTRRCREIGIRMALGAERRVVQWMILRETLLLALLGIVIGLPCAAAGARTVANMLYGVGTSDPMTLVCVSLLLLGVAGLAGFVPAQRAMRLDPIATLHYE